MNHLNLSLLFSSATVLYVHAAYLKDCSHYCKFGNFRECFIFAKLRIRYAKFRENKTLVKRWNHSVVYWHRLILNLSREFLTWQICFFMLFAKNKILVKISEFTVYELISSQSSGEISLWYGFIVLMKTSVDPVLIPLKAYPLMKTVWIWIYTVFKSGGYNFEKDIHTVHFFGQIW